MGDSQKKFEVRSKIWVQDDKGEVVFGLGRLRILESIQKNGSLRAAAQELGMGYRAIWGRVKATEERLGMPILERQKGGRSGGGSNLTPTAVKLVEHFKEMLASVENETDRIFEKLMDGDLDADNKPE